MDKIVILDFGSQYTHLICRRIREFGVYAEILPFDTPLKKLKSQEIKGIIFSGGPASVYEKGSPVVSPKIFELGIPILGICYGHQLIGHLLGGKVERGKREYGKTLFFPSKSELFYGLNKKEIVWMSHRDQITKLPKKFRLIGSTLDTKIAAIENCEKKIYGVQFHPEVSHTLQGKKIFRNFLLRICKCRRNWKISSFITQKVEEIKKTVGNKKVICALSGGVDSSTAAFLVHKAIGKRLTCIFVDHGFMRKNEPEEIKKIFKKKLKMNLIFVDARKRFMRKLKGVRDPEEKRRVIGKEFIRVFEEVAKKLGKIDFLVQGTTYPDVIESAASNKAASRIKTHHNVGGLPSKMKLKLIEPLRELYKDEVRKVAKKLGLPEEIVYRHPFPGPGLAVRIIGEITPEKLRICKEASAIVEEEIKKAGYYKKLWMAFAIVGDDKAVGVLGDERKFGYIVTIRAIESEDGMTGNWAKLPSWLIEKISNRITNEVEGVTWVTYAVSDKPPSTMEPC